MADRRTTTGRGRGSKGKEPESQETERQELELGEEIREPEPERTGDVVIPNQTDYVKLKILEYEEAKLTGEELWGAFKDDFRHFTEEHFAQCSPAFIHKLRMHLRSYGVWVQKDPRVATAKSLFVTVQEQDPATWADNEPVSNTTPSVPTFHSVQMPPEQTVGLTQQIQGPTQRPEFEFGQERQSGFGFGTVLTNLAKMYEEEYKYSGDNDNFDFKLVIFHDLCARADVLEIAKGKAYPTMLRGSALDHYYTNLNNNTQAVPFDQI